MLRIMEEKVSDETTMLRLDGRIVGQWVDLLRANCEQLSQRNAGLVLDLTGVSFADYEGVQLLQHLEHSQVELINCSPFLQEQMKQPKAGQQPS